MKIKFLSLIFSVHFLISCASLTSSIDSACGSGNVENICIGERNTPSDQVDLFSVASKQAINAVNSSQFREEIASFMNEHLSDGAHIQAWNDFNIATVQEQLLGEMNGLEIETYGGIWGLLVNVFAGNIAYDGSTDGPIRLNRWALPRPSASIANTIVHESAHRIGYVHPNSDDDLLIARCEPPYVLGSIVEKIITGSKLNSEGHCKLLM